MSNSKSSSAKRATKGGARRPAANRPSPQQAAAPVPQAVQPATADEAIAKAQRGRVNVPPAKAVEMAGLLYGRGQYAQAERVCRQILAARPGNADAHNILGVTLAAAGHFDEGVAELKRAAKLNPQAASYVANLGEVLRQGGKLDEAQEALEKAVELDPNNAQAL